ncbi:hypothetical protein [Clostridium oceanicum]|uniref:Uncharacterized protein n=1 Tax=Clostridium oceanicum TaxID=1543 RepID=A0ABP3UUZ9_9CLOT
MEYETLPLKFKRKLNGSISAVVNNMIENKLSLMEAYKNWYRKKVYELDNSIYYNEYGYKKEIPDVKKEYEMDKELLNDIKKIICKRYKRALRKKRKKESNNATDKQLTYAEKLYEDCYKKKVSFRDKIYTKEEIKKITEDLKEELEYGKIIEVNFEKAK